MTEQAEGVATGRAPATHLPVVGDVPASSPSATLSRATDRGAEVSASVIAAVKRGDRDSFDEIIAHYDPRLRTLAGQLLHDLSDADDALQEAYIKAYRALSGFRGDCALSTWLYRITYRCCLDHLRRRSVPAEPFEPSEETGAAGDADPADLVASRDALRAALSRLTPRQRAVLFLVHCEGLSYKEAAVILDIPPGTVGSRAAGARAALRSVLLESGETGGTP